MEKALKQWCGQRKERHEEEEMKKIEKIKTEQEAWKHINKYRRRNKRRRVEKSLYGNFRRDRAQRGRENGGASSGRENNGGEERSTNFFGRSGSKSKIIVERFRKIRKTQMGAHSTNFSLACK